MGLQASSATLCIFHLFCLLYFFKVKPAEKNNETFCLVLSELSRASICVSSWAELPGFVAFQQPLAFPTCPFLYVPLPGSQTLPMLLLPHFLINWRTSNFLHLLFVSNIEKLCLFALATFFTSYACFLPPRKWISFPREWSWASCRHQHHLCLSQDPPKASTKMNNWEAIVGAGWMRQYTAVFQKTFLCILQGYWDVRPDNHTL